jgi:hypothetical protein
MNNAEHSEAVVRDKEREVIVAEDPGLWYINGRIRTGAFRERVWAAFKKLTDAYYVRCFAMEARHRAEAATMDREFDEIQKRKPFTPWVGRADEGAVPAFFASAEREDMHLWRRSRQGSDE